MLKVEVGLRESPSRAISRLKALVMKEGNLRMLHERRYYVKPSIKKRLKREAAERQRIKDQIKLIRQIQSEENEFLF